MHTTRLLKSKRNTGFVLLMEHYQHTSSVSGINKRNICGCSRVWTLYNKHLYSRTARYNTVFSSGFGVFHRKHFQLSFIVLLVCWHETKLLKSNLQACFFLFVFFFILVAMNKPLTTLLLQSIQISVKKDLHLNGLEFAVNSIANTHCCF